MREERSEFAKWWFWILMLIIAATIILFPLGVFSRIANTIVEREIFEQSFQYDQAREKEIATYRASIAEMEVQLLNPNLAASDKRNIEVQLAAVRVQLNTAIQMQQQRKGIGR